MSRQGWQDPIPGTPLLLGVGAVIPVGAERRVVGVGARRALRVAAVAGGAERRRWGVPGGRGPTLALAAMAGRRRGAAGAMPVTVLGPLRRGRPGATGAVSAPPGAGGRRLRPAVSPRRGGRRGRPLARGERKRERERERGKGGEGGKKRRKKEKGDFNGGHRAGDAVHNVNAHRIRQATQTLLCTFLSPSTTWVMQTSACKTPKKIIKIKCKKTQRKGWDGSKEKKKKNPRNPQVVGEGELEGKETNPPRKHLGIKQTPAPARPDQERGREKGG